MENTKGLFDLSLDEVAKNHLKESAKWARFLAVSGLILLGIMVLVSMVLLINSDRSAVYRGEEAAVAKQEEMLGTIVGLLIIVVLYFFPCLFMLRYSAKMKTALANDDVESLNEGFKNLKVVLRYLGITTIIFMALFALGLLSELAGT